MEKEFNALTIGKNGELGVVTEDVDDVDDVKEFIRLLKESYEKNCKGIPFNALTLGEPGVVTEEFDLSKKLYDCRCGCGDKKNCLHITNVKEFIRLLKEDCKTKWDEGNFVLANVNEFIDKRAGKDLID